MKQPAFISPKTQARIYMEFHRVIYMISSCSSGRDWLLVFSFSSRVCVKRRRQEWKRNGRGQHREIKKGNLFPKSPQSYQAYVYAWNDEFHFIPNHGRRTFILGYLFSFFSFYVPDQVPHPPFRYRALLLSLYLSYPIHFSMNIFTFFFSQRLCGFSSGLTIYTKCSAPFIPQ